MGTETTGFCRGADLGQMCRDAETPVELTGFGELVCPHCNANITDRPVEAGDGRCPSCKKPFDVPVEIAERANRFGGSVYCLLSGKQGRMMEIKR